VRRPTQRLGERFARVIDTDPIDLRDIRRAAPPRIAVIHQPFAGGARPELPAPPARVRVLGAPIPVVADPVEDAPVWAGEWTRTWSSSRSSSWARPWTRWTPRRRRLVRRTTAGLVLLTGAALVVLALLSMLSAGVPA